MTCSSYHVTQQQYSTVRSLTTIVANRSETPIAKHLAFRVAVFQIELLDRSTFSNRPYTRFIVSLPEPIHRIHIDIV